MLRDRSNKLELVERGELPPKVGSMITVACESMAISFGSFPLEISAIVFELDDAVVLAWLCWPACWAAAAANLDDDDDDEADDEEDNSEIKWR